MDIFNVYLGEGYGRNPITFRDYEKHPYGSWEKNVSKGSYYQQNKSYNSVQSKEHGGSGHGKSKDSCPFCKEQKKRPLVSYMRKRENKKHNESICEEEEEEEQQQQQQQEVKNENKATLLKSQ